MANESWRFPLSGDIVQDINPMSWLVRGGQQFGFVNINASRSGDPALERKIIEDVASYGRQLGRIIEALDVLAARAPAEELTVTEAVALNDFRELAGQIAAVKEGKKRRPLTLGEVDRTISDVQALQQQNPVLYDEIVARFRGAFGVPPAD